MKSENPPFFPSSTAVASPMATAKTNSLAITLTFFLIITTHPSPSASLSFTQYQNLFSLAHSLTTRVANLRASRGDFSGSDRASRIAAQIEQGLGLGFWGVMWKMGWDYLRNYAWWRDPTASFELLRAVSDMNELIGALSELTRNDSEVERVVWLQRNYRNVLRVSKSLFGRLLKVFSHSGPLREVIQTVQMEVVEGDLLRDCLELGSKDLQGLIQIFKDFASQYSATNSQNSDL